MKKNKVKILKPFFAFVTVWHDKANPYNVSSYHFYVVAENEKRVENLIKRKVKTFRYYNHSTTIEEIKLDVEHQREISWQGLDDSLIQGQVKIDVEKIKESISEDYRTSSKSDITGLFLNPEKLYNFLVLHLCSDSKIFIHDGKLQIYNKNNSKTFFSGHFEIEKKHQQRKIKEFFARWHKELNILERDLEER